MNHATHIVIRPDASPVLEFAANELKHYLGKMSPRRAEIRIVTGRCARTHRIWLGTADTAENAPARHAQQAVLQEADSIAVDVADGQGTIIGSNARSVLFGVYRYLETLGCRWLWPGKDGEHIPQVDWREKSVTLHETPSARHRVVCIEGSCSIEHACDMVAHAAKLGFNAYFLQFKTSREFFKRWYTHERPDPQADFTLVDAEQAREQVKREAVKCGMDLHVMGHGWTCEPFGIESEGWERSDTPPPETARPYLAKVNGKREYSGGVPLNTNLCYGNPETRRLMTDAVVDYATSHMDEKYVHVWLADGTNNHCECERCAEKRPSDWYVMILNAIDRRLTALGLQTRIVFLAYVDLLWGPESEVIVNPDRFLLMFAPITRSFDRALTADVNPSETEIPLYRRNQLKFPDDPQANLALLETWNRAFSGERVVFDYHLWQAHHRYPGQLPLARVLHQDCAGLCDIGMAGFISCQAQRVAFPTGIWQYVMGKGLWDSHLVFHTLMHDYFNLMYDANSAQVLDYLTTVSELFAGAFPGAENRSPDETMHIVKKLRAVPGCVDRFIPVIEAECDASTGRQAEAWKILLHHGPYIKHLAEYHARLFEGDPSHKDVLQAMEQWLRETLPEIGHLLDTTICLHQMRQDESR